MPDISSKKPFRIGRSRTGLGLFATKRIKKGAKIIRYFGPLLDSRKKKDDAIENKYLFELNNRWTIDGSVRANVARYINHACRPNAESDVKPRKRKVFIRAIKNIEPGDEINYDYGTDYFKAYLKPIGCKCDACEKKRKKKRAEARAERLRLKAREQKKAERKAKKEAEEEAARRVRAKRAKERAKEQSKAEAELKPDRKRKLDSKSKTPNVRLKAGSNRTKRKVADGVRRNGVTARRSRSKPAAAAPVAPQAASMPAVTEVTRATAEASTVFTASNFAAPAATTDEAQQASG
ncbi:SET domain-containing protein [Bradyrhizobium sp.]|uniref:SET domain-containing protein n=1 Tax=Bradyrhizobium sp. TaxID=376 RepID=UPI0026169C5F|nr:SET domain-containing protein [Bradyrhizobium sp.]